MTSTQEDLLCHAEKPDIFQHMRNDIELLKDDPMALKISVEKGLCQLEKKFNKFAKLIIKVNQVHQQTQSEIEKQKNTILATQNEVILEKEKSLIKYEELERLNTKMIQLKRKLRKTKKENKKLKAKSTKAKTEETKQYGLIVNEKMVAADVQQRGDFFEAVLKYNV